MQQPGPSSLPNPRDGTYYQGQSDPSQSWPQQPQQNGQYQPGVPAQPGHYPYGNGYDHGQGSMGEGYTAGPSEVPQYLSQVPYQQQSYAQPQHPPNAQIPYYPLLSSQPDPQQVQQDQYQQQDPSLHHQQYRYAQPFQQQQQQSYQQPAYHQHYEPASHAQPVPTVEAVPQPQPKVAYEAPVFQTFQERRRAKELALRAQAGTSPAPSSTFTSAPILPSASASSSLSSSSIPRIPSVGPRSPSPLSAGQSPGPSASAVAMMGRPQSVMTRNGPPPTPPARSRSPAIPPIVAPPLRSPSSASPIPYVQASDRPLPSPRVLPPIAPSIAPSPAHVSSASGPPSPFTPTRNDAPLPAGFSPIPAAVVASPIQANLERSDTISSVKSLDRMGFSSSSPVKRALPRPPVGVNSSKSLDRGIPSGVGSGSSTGLEGRRGSNSSSVSVASSNKRPPSVVVEDRTPEMLADGVAAMSMGGSARTPSPSIPVIRTPSPSPQSPASVEPSQLGLVGNKPRADPHTPARYTPLPAISLPDSETSSITSTEDEAEADNRSQQNAATPKAKKTAMTPPAPPSPEIQFSGLPTISVSTSDTADEPEQGGEIGFAVPTINVGVRTAVSSYAGSSSPPTSIGVTPPSVSVPSSNRASQSKPTRVQHDGSAILCAGCGNPIIGRIVNAMNQRWHPQCFMCAECGELLEHVSSYEWEGKAYCHLDYHDTPIVDPRFVTLNDPVLGQRYYHELHFFCSECGDPFLDPSKSSAPGTETTRSRPSGVHSSADEEEEEEEEEGETNAFVIHRGHPYCERCHLRLHKPKCKGCNQPIPDIAINAMGAKWHKECFVCTQCHNEFANNLFFPKDGQAFCTSCYEQIISAS
ncbi:hypothetical protein I316_03568 [Kwoniella heveanensis BCC8398]|uniref:LIM zinc-binding domain-containing protein n=1 Tax=Kwoniella heveanensis BCC8398 TaxID=1296120 RepID=A0A1B9GU13_9TREE|nr:hypothetical protein I316_03568 [Kwoniella heveanensis BCC8398]